MSNDEFDSKLSGLKSARMPTPAEAARRRALGAAMLAFDEAQAAETNKSSGAPQGRSVWSRLRSIVPQRTWIMDTRLSLGLGTAAVALLLLPLGYQLYTSTAITPIGVPPVVHPVEPTPVREEDKQDGLADERQRDQETTVTTLQQEFNGGNAQTPPTVTVELPRPEGAPLGELSANAPVMAQKSAAPGIGRAAAPASEAEAPSDAMAASGAMAPAKPTPLFRTTMESSTQQCPTRPSTDPLINEGNDRHRSAQ